MAGTPVQMAEGSTKPIEQVRQGDLVRSRDPQTGKPMAEAVRALLTAKGFTNWLRD